MEQSIGKRIAHYRRIAQLPQYVLGRAVNRSGAWVCLVEHDAIIPTPDVVAKLAAALNVPTKALLE